MWEFVLALLIGVIVGTFTGLAPGIHINLIATIVTSTLIGFSFLEPIYLVVFIVAMSITHIFVDFIPSIYLGAPEESAFLSVLPGHEMLKEGKGHEAVVLSIYGALLGLIITLLLIPLFLYIPSNIETLIGKFIPFLLIFISSYMILREEKFLNALAVFITAGFLGFVTFNVPVKEPLMPLLTGLFGASGLLISIKENTRLPIQKTEKIRLDKKKMLKTSLLSLPIIPIFAFLPALGSSYAALTISEMKEQSRKAFLISIGIVNFAIMALSFIIIYSIGNARTGSAAAVDKLIELNTNYLYYLIPSIIISAIIAFFIPIFISKLFAKYISKINYKTTSIVVLVLLFILVLVFSNLTGIIVFLTSTSLGVFCILSKIRRINLMGALILPTIIIYLS